jgi:hypothetical protein
VDIDNVKLPGVSRMQIAKTAGRNIWNRVTVKEENMRIKLDNQYTNKPTVKIKSTNKQIRRRKNQSSMRGGGGGGRQAQKLSSGILGREPVPVWPSCCPEAG